MQARAHLRVDGDQEPHELTVCRAAPCGSPAVEAGGFCEGCLTAYKHCRRGRAFELEDRALELLPGMCIALPGLSTYWQLLAALNLAARALYDETTSDIWRAALIDTWSDAIGV